VALLPENGRREQQWKDHRKVINGILWKLRTGAPWRDLPSCCSPWLDRIVSHLVPLFEGLEATAGYARVVHVEVFASIIRRNKAMVSSTGERNGPGQCSSRGAVA
jgi:transposase